MARGLVCIQCLPRALHQTLYKLMLHKNKGLVLVKPWVSEEKSAKIEASLT